MSMITALVVDDDETLRFTVRGALERHGLTVKEAQDGQEALKVIDHEGPFDIVILDVNMPRLSGIETLKAIKEKYPETFCLVATAYSDLKDAIYAIKLGAFDYIEKPIMSDHIVRLIDNASQAKALIKAVAFSAPRMELGDGKSMIGDSTSIRRVFDIIYKLSKVDTSVLIRGESGTGKELVAKAIHFNSSRRKGPFVAVNCAAIPENLIESELFGYEKGSFTGAEKKKIGKFQFAEGGTIFLDEIGDISSQMQVKLLRVLQERKVTPVGSNEEQSIDVRVVAATNRPLEQMMDKGTFRSDLYYRLNVLPIHLPALRERREDLNALVDFMIKKFNKLHNRNVRSMEIKALNLLKLYSWPGNIRELENVIEHCFIMEPGDTLSIVSLPPHIQEMQQRASSIIQKLDDVVAKPASEKTVEGAMSSSITHFDISSDLDYPSLKEQFEKEFIIRALKTFDGKVNQTAENTKMTKVTLLRKLEKYGIDPRQYHRPKRHYTSNAQHEDTNS